jgi:hypothetical protein
LSTVPFPQRFDVLLSRRALGGSTFGCADDPDKRHIGAWLTGLTSVVIFVIAVLGVVRAYLALHSM